MSNSNAPFGLKPVRHLNSSPYNGQFNEYFVPSTDAAALYIGDVVKLAGSSADDGTPTVARAAATNALLLGAVVGFRPDPNNLSLNYRPASTDRYVYVADDPTIIYEMQEDSVGGALTVDEVGECGDIVATAGSTATGLSGMVLDSSDVLLNGAGGTGSAGAQHGSAQIKILRLSPRRDNVIGNYAVWEVLINEHAFKSTTGV